MPDCPTIAEFKDRFKGFAAVEGDEVQIYLTDACNFISYGLFGDCWSTAVLYYAAHCLSIALKTAERSSGSGIPAPEPSGNVTSSSSDGLSVGYGGVSGGDSEDAWYNLTPYGKQFLIYARRCVHPSDVAGFTFGRSLYGSVD